MPPSAITWPPRASPQAPASGAEEEPALPPALHLDLSLVQPLRYGENPHQAAALYNWPGAGGPLGGRLLHGKPLSYNNLLDLDAAWRAVRDFAEPTIAIIKHTNPCGLASAQTLAAAYPLALAGDPQAAYGGILAANRPLDDATVAQIGSLFLECIVAPGFEPPALERLNKKANLRLLEMPPEPNKFGAPETGRWHAAECWTHGLGGWSPELVRGRRGHGARACPWRVGTTRRAGRPARTAGR